MSVALPRLHEQQLLTSSLAADYLEHTAYQWFSSREYLGHMQANVYGYYPCEHWGKLVTLYFEEV